MNLLLLIVFVTIFTQQGSTQNFYKSQFEYKVNIGDDWTYKYVIDTQYGTATTDNGSTVRIVIKNINDSLTASQIQKLPANTSIPKNVYVDYYYNNKQVLSDHLFSGGNVGAGYSFYTPVPTKIDNATFEEQCRYLFHSPYLSKVTIPIANVSYTVDNGQFKVKFGDIMSNFTITYDLKTGWLLSYSLFDNYGKNGETLLVPISHHSGSVPVDFSSVLFTIITIASLKKRKKNKKI